MANRDAELQNELESASTFPNSKYIRREYLETVEDKLGRSWLDPLTPAYTSLISSNIETEPYEYDGNEPITTVCYKLYGTTSPWHMILYLNGYMHPQEIPSGVVLNVPTPSFIQNFARTTLAELERSSVGTTQVI